jgi:hypothetical protein
MSTSSLMSSTALTPEDRALLAETAAPDLPPALTGLIALMQPTSPELVRDDPKEVRGAAVGDFIVPHAGERMPFKGSTGYTFLIIGAERGFPEYWPARGGFIAPHDTKPDDARWLRPEESPDGKEGLYRSLTNTRIEETIYIQELVLPADGSAPFVATQPFHSTALPVGKDMLKRAQRKLT